MGGLLANPDPDASRVPVLGDVPVVGRLFRGRDRTQRRTSLVIFVSPVLYDEATGRALPAGTGSLPAGDATSDRPGTTHRPGGTRLEPVVRPKPDAQLQHGPQVPRSGQPGYGQRYPTR